MTDILACEELATKAELQELRDQINALLGKREGGGELIDVLDQGNLFDTEINARLIEDFEVEINESTGEIQTAFLIRGPGEVTNKVIKDAATQSLKDVRSLATGGIRLGKLAWKLATNNDDRAQANEQFWKGIADLIDKNDKLRKLEVRLRANNNRAKNIWEVLDRASGGFTQMSQDLEAYKQVVADNKVTFEELKNDYIEQENRIRDLENMDFIQNDAIAQVNQDIADINAWIIEDNLLDSQFRTEVLSDLLAIEAKFSEQDSQIAELTNYINTLANRVVDTELDIDDIIIDFTEIEIEQDNLEARVADIEAFIGANPDVEVFPGSESTTSDNVIKRTRRGGVPAGVREGFVNQQTTTIYLLDKLTGNNTSFEPSYFDIVNGNDPFPDISTSLIEQVESQENFLAPGTDPNTNTEQVNQQELDTSLASLETNINNSVATIVAAIIASQVTPPLNNIQNNTSPNAIRSAANQAMCDQANDANSCLNTQIRNPIQNSISSLGDFINEALGSLNALLNAQILARIIAMQNFLTTAWSSTRADKILNAIGAVLSLHNAMMLSRNLGSSIGETASLFLNAIGVKDKDGEAIDINEILSDRVEQVVNSVIGANNAQAIGSAFNAANRVLTAAQGVVSAIRGIKDSLQNGQEIIANRVGHLGNAFMDQGILEEDSFAWMDTDVNFRTYFQGLTNTIQNLQEVVDETNELVQTGIEVQEAFGEITNLATEFSAARTSFEEAMEEFDVTTIGEKEDEEAESVSPAIGNPDLVKDED